MKEPIIGRPHWLVAGVGVGIGVTAMLTQHTAGKDPVDVAGRTFAVAAATGVFIIILLLFTSGVLALTLLVRHLTDEVFPRFHQVRQDVATIGQSMLDPATRDRVHRIAEAKRLAAEPDLLLDGPTDTAEWRQTWGDAEVDRLVAAEITKDRQAKIDQLMKGELAKRAVRGR